MKKIAISTACSAALLLAVWSSACIAQNAAASNWQTFNDAGSALTMQFPQNWKSSVDAKSGRIDLVSSSGAALSILPFSIAGQTVAGLNPKEFFSVFVKMFAPSEAWTAPTPIGQNGFNST